MKSTQNMFFSEQIYNISGIIWLFGLQSSQHSFLIRDGRHPVVERQLRDGRFVPNDMQLDSAGAQIMLITGPTMAGKSTIIRQVGLIVLMGQIGSFVPARSAKIGVVDRIFTRVGASDNLARGESTFMVEMNEAANILNNTTAKSLILMDELGRGTSTFDGLSIAWAIVEFLHQRTDAHPRTLFAPHSHAMTELESHLERVVNFNVQVREEGDLLAGSLARRPIGLLLRGQRLPLCGTPRARSLRARTTLSPAAVPLSLALPLTVPARGLFFPAPLPALEPVPLPGDLQLGLLELEQILGGLLFELALGLRCLLPAICHRLASRNPGPAVDPDARTHTAASEQAACRHPNPCFFRSLRVYCRPHAAGVELQLQ